MDELKDLMIKLWQAACMDAPLRPSCRVEEGHFVLAVNGNQGQWTAIAQAAGVPSHAIQAHNGDQMIVTWPSHADRIFAADGPIAQRIGPGYEVRQQQIQMGRLVQRAIEMREPAVVEAGTGTGKSFAYAAVCMAMDKRVIISTSNKALQMQLYAKDIPFLQQIYPQKRVALAVGKSNYACRAKAEDGVGNVALDGDLQRWYLTTETGNTEEIPFAVDWQQLSSITVDEGCTGRACGFYHECFYYKAKAARATADVVITNHALLCLNELYSGAGILPNPDVIVVDEAHKLADYARNALGVEFNLRQIEKAIKKADKHDADNSDAWTAYAAMERDLQVRQYTSDSKEIPLEKDEEIAAAKALAEALEDLADAVWPEDEMPNEPEERRAARDADYIRSRASWVMVVSSATQPLHVRYIDQSDKQWPKFVNVPFDVSAFVGKLAGFETATVQAADHTQCARCGRKLSAAVVNVLEGLPYGPDCITHVDHFGDAEKVSLAEWLAADHTEEATTRGADAVPVIFTSATLAAPDMAHFMRECGIDHALQMQVESPFDYKRQALFYVPNGTTPDPRDTAAFQQFMADDMRRLVCASQGGAFLLFTSYANMQFAAQALRGDFEARGWTVFVQGELPKLEIAKRFKEDGSAVLFATKSFFEGVSIDGAALRLVVIDKMPFEAPSPLNTAQEAAAREWAAAQGMKARDVEWYPFNALRLPKMIIELKQGVGRLIRTDSDEGVFAVLDPRVRSAPYGRRVVIPSLPRAPMVAHTEAVHGFFAQRQRAQAAAVRAEAVAARDAKLGGAMLAQRDVTLTDDDILLWGGK